MPPSTRRSSRRSRPATRKPPSASLASTSSTRSTSCSGAWTKRVTRSPSAAPSLPELREVAVAPLARRRGVAVAVLDLLGRPQLDAADLAGDRLRQLGELEPADALVGREVLARVAQDGERGVAVGAPPPGAARRG